MPSRVVRARLDPASEDALAALMREGRNESEAVRAALLESAGRRRRRAAVAADAARIAADAADRAEVRAVLADLDAISPEWPE